ncbi:aromatic ring-hydroxylating dioxygenase subunit alpha [Acetobacter suratthaniensis]|uniref:Aromatic ring-hydroxylating dioxygenase subunit alpha n=1 Tax=Acetobacter suratthaniensis TaxID=1502841 RepID=A0ABS3LL79_9PROT|nr:aromatic ring-hydroxylating dioxygenase subunit alpha [Acetobacter suratthaniensis]MBO1327706.1 aromatic ring-hydroxylating dioxygenase subunit alpha [Acetobacter suratthaniensis]MCX2565688.1 aromatic ring-hydroxylating dioxygenase subunit alpha [Acetobacter suratthaniensis]
MSVKTILSELEGCTDSALLNDWHVVAYSTDLEQGKLLPVTLMERDLVLWRSASGEVHAWDDLCIHRGARLSKGCIERDTVVCPYHGWRYNDQGSCVLIPAAPNEPPMKKARAITHPVKERYGFIWVSTGTPEKDIPVFPEWDDASYQKVHCGPYTFRSGYRAVENFMDPSHFPFVHAGVNGIYDNPDPIAPYDVELTEEGLVTSEVRVTQPYGDPRQIPVIAYYAYTCFRPLVAYFKKRLVIQNPEDQHLGNEDDRFCTFLTTQMVDQQTSIVRICCAMNFNPQPTVEDVRRRQDIVYAQDAGIVDTQRPERIPVDLRLELHHRSDLLGQKYRKWLQTMGITYGVF